MLVDSHCHLDFPDFGGDVDGIINRARGAGVGAMLTIGTKIADFPRVRAIAEGHDNVWCSVGVHPHEAAVEPDVDTARLAALARHPKVVGIGETGLDYFYEHSPRAGQVASFRAHIAAARGTGLPLIVHTRDADGDTGAILAEQMGQGAFTGLIHCFSSSLELARTALDLGLLLSFSGIVTFKNAHNVREAARFAPLDRILVETDAPYLAPVPHRGKRNEPAFTTHTAAVMAELKGVSAGVLADRTTENFFRLFAKCQPGPPA